MKRLLITGASSGIGKAVALRAAELGFDVTACGRNQERLDDLTHENAAIKTLAFDVADQADCAKALEAKAFDIVVLNAGTCEYVDVDSFEPDMFRRVFDANFFGAVNCLNAVLPNLKAGNQLVFVDSLARLLPFTRSQAYGASKAALFYLAKTMEVDLATKGVVVQSISPGFVRTPLTDKNDFDMPMRVEVDEAANSIINLIQKQKRTGYFPTLFAGIIRTLGSLPTAWQVALCRRMKSATAAKREATHEAA